MTRFAQARNFATLFWRLSQRVKNLVKKIHPTHWRATREISSRQRWDQEARWYRLRYGNGAKARDMLNRISRVSGRVGMRWRYGRDGAVQCWVGVENYYADALERMAPTFECRLSDGSTGAPEAIPGAFVSGKEVPDNYGALDAYVVNERFYVLAEAPQEMVRVDESAFAEGDTAEDEGIFFPVPGHTAEAVSTSLLASTGVPGIGIEINGQTGWVMPPPVLGTTTRPHLKLLAPPQMYRQPGNEWLLGWDAAQHSVGAHQVGVIGDDDSVLSWLYALTLARLQEGLKLVVLDGGGKLTQLLTKQAHINRMIARGEASVLDIARATQSGFNPLAWPQSDAVGAVGAIARWQWWFQGMGVRREQSQELIEMAVQAGVQDIPHLYQWLNGKKRSYPDAVMTLRTYMERLDRDENVREWILRPDRFVDPRTLSRRGLLVVNGRLADGSSWARTQAMRGLLGLMVESGAALLVHDFKLGKQDKQILRQAQLAVSKTVMNAMVVTRSNSGMARRALPHLPTDKVSVEHLVLLPDRVAVIKKGGQVALAAWKKR